MAIDLLSYSHDVLAFEKNVAIDLSGYSHGVLAMLKNTVIDQMDL